MPNSVRFSGLSTIHVLAYSDKDGVYFKFEGGPLQFFLPLFQFSWKGSQLSLGPFLILGIILQFSFPYNLQAFLSVIPKYLLYSVKFCSCLPALFLPLLPSLGRENSFYSPISSFLNLFFLHYFRFKPSFPQIEIAQNAIDKVLEDSLTRMPSPSLVSFLQSPLDYI